MIYHLYLDAFIRVYACGDVQVAPHLVRRETLCACTRHARQTVGADIERPPLQPRHLPCARVHSRTMLHGERSTQMSLNLLRSAMRLGACVRAALETGNHRAHTEHGLLSAILCYMRYVICYALY